MSRAGQETTAYRPAQSMRQLPVAALRSATGLEDSSKSAAVSAQIPGSPLQSAPVRTKSWLPSSIRVEVAKQGQATCFLSETVQERTREQVPAVHHHEEKDFQRGRDHDGRQLKHAD